MNGIDELLLFLGSNPEEVRGREGGRERSGEIERDHFISFLLTEPVVYACFRDHISDNEGTG